MQITLWYHQCSYLGDERIFQFRLNTITCTKVVANVVHSFGNNVQVLSLCYLCTDCGRSHHHN